MLSFKQNPVSSVQVHETVTKKTKSGYNLTQPANLPIPKKGYKVVYLMTIVTAKGVHTYMGSTVNLYARLSYHLSTNTWSRLGRYPLYAHLSTCAHLPVPAYVAVGAQLSPMAIVGATYTPTVQIQVVTQLPIKEAQEVERQFIISLQERDTCLNVRIGAYKGKPENRKKKVTGYKNTHKKPFIAYNTKTGGKTQWQSTVACAAGLGLNQGNISNALKGNFKKVKHYKFFYI